MATYKLTKYFKAPIVGAKNTRDLTFCEFKHGDVVSGQVYKGKPTDNIVPQLIVAFDGGRYSIPLQYLEEVKTSSADGTDTKKSVQDIQDQTFTKSIINSSKASINGVLIGAAVGMIIAWVSQSPNKWYWAIGGAVAGGVFSRKKPQDAIQELAKTADKETEVKKTDE